ncbi:hypothetical protein NL676_034677 [Syzygium grande]|nr:hypothetical protein NL676_034677 [Syzygium grande]
MTAENGVILLVSGLRASLLSSSLLTIIAFFLRFLPVRGPDPHAQDPAPGLPGRREAAVAAGELREAVEKAKMTPADMRVVLLIKNRRNKERAVGKLLEALKARTERNDK